MLDRINSLTVTEIGNVLYVPPNTGKRIHKNRTFHGLVLNDENSVKDYCFGDGNVMRTGGNELFYLPEGSDYEVKIVDGKDGCYAINFDVAESFCGKPFVIKPRDCNSIRDIFEKASGAWLRHDEKSRAYAMLSVYQLFYKIMAENERKYIPYKLAGLLAPAESEIQKRYADPDLSVAELANLCDMSDTYFRRVFGEVHGMSPKSYIVMLRINRAKQLLKSEHFSCTETAFACGYKEAAHFSREFKKNVGVSPAEYREGNK